MANGTCGGLLPSNLPNPFDLPEVDTCTLTEAEYDYYDYDNSKQDYDYYDYGAPMEIAEGVCSAKTEELLSLREECGFFLRQQPNLIFNTIIILLQLSCNTEIVTNLLIDIVISFPFRRNRNRNRQSFNQNKTSSSRPVAQRFQNRLPFYQNKKFRPVAPVELVTEYGDTVSTVLDLGKSFLIIYIL